MRTPLLIAVLISVALWMGDGAALAQQQSPPADSNTQPAAPDASQPQKKAAKPASAAKSSAQKSTPQSASDANAFPEDISRKAAQAAGNSPTSEDSSPPQAAGTKSSSAGHSATDANAFPEDVSRKAADAANHGKVPLPPDESSSQASSLAGILPDNSVNSFGVANPARAKKDIEVGDFYMAQEDYKGAYTRYQDAMKSDPANVDAIFGAGEAARHLGKLSEAARNYQMYLEIEPNGSKAKRALKALNALPAKK